MNTINLLDQLNFIETPIAEYTFFAVHMEHSQDRPFARP